MTLSRHDGVLFVIGVFFCSPQMRNGTPYHAASYWPFADMPQMSDLLATKSE